MGRLPEAPLQELKSLLLGGLVSSESVCLRNLQAEGDAEAGTATKVPGKGESPASLGLHVVGDRRSLSITSPEGTGAVPVPTPSRQRQRSSP